MRIASLQPSVTLTLASLNRLDLLCACTKYCVEAMPELAARELTVLHDSWTASTEEIRACAPNLVIASVPYRMESLAAILKAGLPVLALAPHSIADVYADIRLIAAVADSRERGEKTVATIQQAIAEARALTAHLPKRRVYCEEWGKPIIHSQPWVAELIEAAGGEFIGRPGEHTTAEAVAAAGPDVLLFAWCGAGDRVPLTKVVQQRGWASLHAVECREVYCIPDEYLNTPAPTLLEGLAYVAAAVRPELFPKQERLVRLPVPRVDPSHEAQYTLQSG